MGTCYVCLDDEDDAPPSACDCRDRYLHVACQQRMLEYKQEALCDVCRAPFTNVEVHVVSSRGCHPFVALVYVLGGCILYANLVYFISVDSSPRQIVIALFAVSLWIVIVLQGSRMPLHANFHIMHRLV